MERSREINALKTGAYKKVVLIPYKTPEIDKCWIFLGIS